MKKVFSIAVSLLLVIGLLAVAAPAASAKPLSEYRILILKEFTPWKYPAVENTLRELGIPYDVMNETEFQGKSVQELVERYDMIIVPTSQGIFKTEMGKLGEYANAGGILELHLANWGEIGYLPGEVLVLMGSSYSSNYDYIVSTGELLYGTYSSQGYFIIPPEGTEIVTIQAPNETIDQNRPSSIRYSFGNGKIFLTTMPIEYNMWRESNGEEGFSGWMEFYKRIILQNLGYKEMPSPEISKIGSFSILPEIMGLTLYYHIRYTRLLEEYNHLYPKAVEEGMDNKTLQIAGAYNATAADHYLNATSRGPVLRNLYDIFVFIHLRKAFINEMKAVEILKESE